MQSSCPKCGTVVNCAAPGEEDYYALHADGCMEFSMQGECEHYPGERHNTFKGMEFKAEDFFKRKAFYPDEDTSDWAARVANVLLRERLEQVLSKKSERDLNEEEGVAVCQSPTCHMPNLYYIDKPINCGVCGEKFEGEEE